MIIHDIIYHALIKFANDKLCMRVSDIHFNSAAVDQQQQTKCIYELFCDFQQ